MKKFINDPYDVVDEMLEGFLDVHKKYVRKLDAARTATVFAHRRPSISVKRQWPS